MSTILLFVIGFAMCSLIELVAIKLYSPQTTNATIVSVMCGLVAISVIFGLAYLGITINNYISMVY